MQLQIRFQNLLLVLLLAVLKYANAFLIANPKKVPPDDKEEVIMVAIFTRNKDGNKHTRGSKTSRNLGQFGFLAKKFTFLFPNK